MMTRCKQRYVANNALAALAWCLVSCCVVVVLGIHEDEAGRIDWFVNHFASFGRDLLSSSQFHHNIKQTKQTTN